MSNRTPKNVQPVSTSEDPRDADIWTPALVSAALLAALNHAAATAGPTSPKEPQSPDAGWSFGLPFVDEIDPNEAPIDPTPPRQMRISRSPEEITFLEEVLRWQSVHLPRNSPHAHVLKVWLQCKVHRVPFIKAARTAGWPHVSAYRSRDTALGMIASALEKERIPVWRF